MKVRILFYNSTSEQCGDKEYTISEMDVETGVKITIGQVPIGARTFGLFVSEDEV